MNEKVKKEIEQIIKEVHSICSIDEFKNNVYWENISKYQNLSEEFIREFKDLLNWKNIFTYQQNLSEEFIQEFKNKIEE